MRIPLHLNGATTLCTISHAFLIGIGIIAVTQVLAFATVGRLKLFQVFIRQQDLNSPTMFRADVARIKTVAASSCGPLGKSHCSGGMAVPATD
ncbi:hypothetical protein SH528x_001041 [Novipirellula sp. SH528]|uniref:hypothetical protein n=1 Tax=Novipirellula sp. SH528 TaxID=3454466 RepID=UPI003FA0A85C